MCDALLLAVGETGYAASSVDDVLARTGRSSRDFHSHFEDVGECFARAYELRTDLVCRRLVELTSRQPDWIEAMRAGLDFLLESTAQEPLLAKALVLEVHAAREVAIEQRERFLARLSRAVDAAREDPRCLPFAPPLTAGFVVGGIESSIFALLVDGEPA